MTVLGLDIGGSSVKAAVFRRGRCVATRQSRAYENPDLGTLKAAIAEVAGESRVKRIMKM